MSDTNLNCSEFDLLLSEIMNEPRVTRVVASTNAIQIFFANTRKIDRKSATNLGNYKLYITEGTFPSQSIDSDNSEIFFNYYHNWVYIQRKDHGDFMNADSKFKLEIKNIQSKYYLFEPSLTVDNAEKVKEYTFKSNYPNEYSIILESELITTVSNHRFKNYTVPKLLSTTHTTNVIKLKFSEESNPAPFHVWDISQYNVRILNKNLTIDLGDGFAVFPVSSTEIWIVKHGFVEFLEPEDILQVTVDFLN